MQPPESQPSPPPDVAEPKPEPWLRFELIGWGKALLFALIAVACFHGAYFPAHSGWFALGIFGYVICLTQLARLNTTRKAFYAGLIVALACYAPQLDCFWRIFGPVAISLWTILALWIGFFVALTHVAIKRLGPVKAALLVPFLWTGLEYFRSELYYLKFSWMNVGYVFAEWFIPFSSMVGMYGIGFFVALYAAYFLVKSAKQVLVYTLLSLLAAFLFLAFIGPTFAVSKRAHPRPNIRLAGIQLEFPSEKQVIQSLNKLVAEQDRQAIAVVSKLKVGPLNSQEANFLFHTNLDLVVLSEYTFSDGEPTQQVKDWCKQHQKFLIVGGKQMLGTTNFYNTAFVISTNGEVVFKQVKCTPIQFFKDGLPATEQKLWQSPWGKIGICICYDLSYTRVTDELIRQGAQMLVVPTMDVADWGQHQHELHARVAPTRAAEYGVPIFRLASSGISQGVNGFGRVMASAPFPGEGETIFFGAVLPKNGGMRPLDRWLGPFCVAVTGAFFLWVLLGDFKEYRKRKQKPVA